MLVPSQLLNCVCIQQHVAPNSIATDNVSAFPVAELCMHWFELGLCLLYQDTATSNSFLLYKCFLQKVLFCLPLWEVGNSGETSMTLMHRGQHRCQGGNCLFPPRAYKWSVSILDPHVHQKLVMATFNLSPECNITMTSCTMR